MAIARVQAGGSGATSASSTTQTVTLTGVTAGNALIVCIGEHVASIGTVSSVSDTHNTYTQATGAYGKYSTTTIGDLWYCKNVGTGGSLTITVTFSVAGGGCVTVIEVSGQDTTTFFDQIASAVASSTAPNSGATPSTTAANEFVVGMVSTGNNISGANTPVFSTSLTSQTAETLADNTSPTGDKESVSVWDGLLASSSVAETFSATQASDPWVAICATFLPSSGGTDNLTSTAAGQSTGTANLTVTQALTSTAASNSAASIVSGGSGGTPTRVQAFGNTGAAGTTTTAAATVTSGNYLVAVGAVDSHGISGIADSLSNTWTPLPVSGGSTFLGAWTAPVTTGGSTTVTLTSLGTAHGSLSILEISGQNATPIDVSVSAHGTGTAPNSGATGTPAGASELAIGLVAAFTGSADLTLTSPSFSPGLSSTTNETVEIASTGSGVQITDGPISSAAAETFSATTSGTSVSWSCWALVIAGASGGGPGFTEVATLTGAGAEVETGTANITSSGSSVNLTGTGAEVGAASATLTSADSFTSTAAGTSTGTANLAVTRAVSGTGAETETGTANLSAAVAPTGTGAGTSTGTAALTVAQAHTGTGAEVSTGTGSLTEAATLTGTGAEVSTGTANVTSSGGSVDNVSGTGAETGSGTANLTASDSLASTGASGSTGTATVSLFVALQGTAATTEQGTAAITGGLLLTATAATTSAGTAAVTFTGTFLLTSIAAATSYGQAIVSLGVFRWLNAPPGWQPWNIPEAYQVTSWDTEVYQGNGLGSPPAVNQTVVVANVQMGANVLKVWIDAASVQPSG